MHYKCGKSTNHDITNVDQSTILWELMNRILNAKIGRATRNYRYDVLTRHNGVNLKPSLTVTLEKKTLTYYISNVVVENNYIIQKLI